MEEKYMTLARKMVDGLSVDPNVLAIMAYGSLATRTLSKESDIDLLVLTSRELSRLEHRALLEALYDIQLQHDVLLSPLVVLRTDWEAGLYSVLPLHFEIDRDGVTA